MYKLTIKTKYNVITLETEDYNSPEIQEILEQPYVEWVKLDNLDVQKLERKKKNDG